MNAPHWQNSLNSQLIQRLTRPLRQPGVIDRQLATTILNRSDRFQNRLPLFTQQWQRWGQNTTLQVDQIPIVYAEAVSSQRSTDPIQPSAAAPAPVANLAGSVVNSAPAPLPPATSFQPEPGALFNPSSAPVERDVGISSANSEASGILPLQAKFESPTTISDVTSPSQLADLPLVNPQPATSGFAAAGELPLQAKFDSAASFTPDSTEPSASALLSTISTPDFTELSSPALFNQAIPQSDAVRSSLPTVAVPPESSTALTPLEFVAPVVDSAALLNPNMKVGRTTQPPFPTPFPQIGLPPTDKTKPIPLAPLKRGNQSQEWFEVPLLKGDLGGSHSAHATRTNHDLQLTWRSVPTVAQLGEREGDVASGLAAQNTADPLLAPFAATKSDAVRDQDSTQPAEPQTVLPVVNPLPASGFAATGELLLQAKFDSAASFTPDFTEPSSSAASSTPDFTKLSSSASFNRTIPQPDSVRSSLPTVAVPPESSTALTPLEFVVPVVDSAVLLNPNMKGGRTTQPPFPTPFPQIGLPPTDKTKPIPLAPLKRGDQSQEWFEVPLLKGDLGGSHSAHATRTNHDLQLTWRSVPTVAQLAGRDGDGSITSDLTTQDTANQMSSPLTATASNAVRNQDSTQPTEPQTVLPVVNPLPASGFAAGELLLQTQVATPGRSLRSDSSVSSSTQATVPDSLPIVSAQPIAATSRRSHLNGITENVTENVTENLILTQLKTIQSGGNSTAARNRQTTGLHQPLPVIRPQFTPPPTEPEITDPSVAALRVAAQPTAPVPSMPPFVFSTSVSGGNHFGHQARAPAPQTGDWTTPAQGAIVSPLDSSTPVNAASTVQSQIPASSPSQSIDLEAMAAKLERRLLRRLMIESERRGQSRWGLKN